MTVESVPAHTPALEGSAAASDAPHFMRRLLRRKVAVGCLIYLSAIVLVAVIAPIALPNVSGEQAGNILATHQGPSSAHLLGTDTLGRDVLERLLVGTRITVEGVVEALAVILLLGVPLGLVAGYFGGRLERVVLWLADIAFSIPGVVVVLMVLSIFPSSMLAAMVAFGVLVTPVMLRVVRAAVLPIRHELYISAARVSGLSHRYILAKHVLPRVAGPIVVQASLLGAMTLIVETGLSFLGLLVKAPAPSWGGMVADGISVITLDPWLIWPPGVMIALTVLALGLLGDSVRDAVTEGWTASVPRTRARRASHSTAISTALHDSDALLAISGLMVSFERPDGSRVQVVDDVGFDIRPGETVGVVGESGCGKTATAMSILGLLPRTGELDAGRIVFDGRDLAAMSERELHAIRGKDIGLVSQEPMVAFDPTFRIGSQISEVIRTHHDVSKGEARQRTLDLLRRVNLPNPETAARAYPHELSGGMAQRAVIARALAGEPRLLIADEPTTALDVTVQAEILDLLRELQQERQMAILLITHDWGVVADLCDRAVVLYAGQVVERGEIISMFQAPGHPYTRALLAANPHGSHSERMLPTIGGTVPQPGEWPTGCHFAPRCQFATDECRGQTIPLFELPAGRASRCIRRDQLEDAT